MNKLFEKVKRVPDFTVRCYLTLKCDLQCEFCSAQIPQVSGPRQAVWIPAEAWAEGLNRRRRHTILAGGEPFMYPQFHELIGLLNNNYKVEIYTNLRHPVAKFVHAAKRKFSFLISLHPGTDLDDWRERVRILDNAGHSLRFHVVRAPGYEKLAQFLTDSGITGYYRTALQGDQRAGPKSAGAAVNEAHPLVRCTSRIILYGPEGDRWHCIHKMVTGDITGRFDNAIPVNLEKELGLGCENLVSYANMREPDRDIQTQITCREFGFCAGCDNNIEGSVEDVA